MYIYAVLCENPEWAWETSKAIHDQLEQISKQLVKCRVDFKRSEWPQFNKVLKALSEEQQASSLRRLYLEVESMKSSVSSNIWKCHIPTGFR